MANYSLIYKLIADDKQFKSGMNKASSAIDKHNTSIKRTGLAHRDLNKRMRLLQDNARITGQVMGTKSKEFKKATLEAAKFRGELDRVNKAMVKAGAMGKTGGGGGLTGSIAGVAMRRIAPLLAIGTVTRQITDIASKMSKFEQTMSQVAAITGATSDELMGLEQSALRISSVTPRTASEVANLQVELAKLGFTAKQIQSSTKGIINLSVAGFNDLGETSLLVAQSMNAFNLSAGMSREVTDTFAHAISTSALDLQKLATGLPNVGTAAMEFGWSIQRTTGLLGILANAGIDASKMGTDLRMVITKLSKSGMTLDESLAIINKSTNKVAAAQDMFGQRAFVSALALARQSEEIKGLDEAFSDIDGTADRMANIMQQNVLGALKEVSSSWERFINMLKNDKGFIYDFFSGMASAINKVSIAMGGLNQENIDEISSKTRKTAKDMQSGFSDEKEGLKNSIDEIRKYIDTRKSMFSENFGGFEFDEVSATDVKGNSYLRRALGGELMDVLTGETTYSRAPMQAAQEEILGMITVLDELEAKLASLNKTGGDTVKGKVTVKGEREKIIRKINPKKATASSHLDLLAQGSRDYANQMIAAGDIDAAVWFEKQSKGFQQIIDSSKLMNQEVQGAFDGSVYNESTARETLGLMAEEFDSIAQEFIANGAFTMIDTAMDDFFMAIETKDWSQFGSGILGGMGSFIESFGQMLAQQALLTMAASALALNPATAPLALGIGIAAMAVGKAMQMKFGAGGGSITGGGGSSINTPSVQNIDGYSRYTTGYGGEASNSGASNSPNTVNVEGEFKVRGTDLIASIEKTERRNKNFR